MTGDCLLDIVVKNVNYVVFVTKTPILDICLLCALHVIE